MIADKNFNQVTGDFEFIQDKLKKCPLKFDDDTPNDVCSICLDLINQSRRDRNAVLDITTKVKSEELFGERTVVISPGYTVNSWGARILNSIVFNSIVCPYDNQSNICARGRQLYRDDSQLQFEPLSLNEGYDGYWDYETNLLPEARMGI